MARPIEGVTSAAPHRDLEEALPPTLRPRETADERLSQRSLETVLDILHEWELPPTDKYCKTHRECLYTMFLVYTDDGGVMIKGVKQKTRNPIEGSVSDSKLERAKRFIAKEWHKTPKTF